MIFYTSRINLRKVVSEMIPKDLAADEHFPSLAKLRFILSQVLGYT